MIIALSICFVFLVMILALGAVDHAGIAMLDQDRRERLSREALAKREQEHQAAATMFPTKASALTESQVQAFHAATPGQRRAYLHAVVSGNAHAAEAAGAAFGFPADYVAGDLKSDWANAQREQIKLQEAEREQKEYGRLMATHSMTPAQARFAAGMKLPERAIKSGPIPSEDPNFDPVEKLAMKAGLTKGQAAFASILEIPPH